jgi:putative addiction module component (TIGR02574 family)
MTAAMLLQEALKLPVEEREKLCDELQHSLPSPGAAELARRLEAHRQRPDEVISREELEAKWQKKWNWKP